MFRRLRDYGIMCGMKKIEKEFEQISAFIERSRNAAVGFMNYAAISTYWAVGAYVSGRLKSAAWGSKAVVELGDYLKTRNPTLKGFGRRQLYNMIAFYDTYSSPEFHEFSERLNLDEFVQALPSPIVHFQNARSGEPDAIVHFGNAQSSDLPAEVSACPMFLSLVNFTNHVIIMNRCRSMDEKIFYILHGARERLFNEEMKRAISNDVYASVMRKEKLVTKTLSHYPGADFLLRDRALLDFLKLPAKHTEPQLHVGIRENIKKFILELGKDFLWMGDEYTIQVGSRRRRLDLLFYHRALRCLVDVELKAVPFKADFIGKMDLYLSAIDHELRRPDENPSIGILLCPRADAIDVRYTLDRTMSPMLVAEYRRLLVPEDVMKKSLAEYCAFLKRHEVRKVDEA